MATLEEEELEGKASLALKDPKLVELVKNAPLSSEGKVNLSWVDRESFTYALGETGSVKTAEELRKSTRALAMMRRDYEEDFWRLVSQVSQRDVEEKRQEKKRFCEMEFYLPDRASVIMSAGYDGSVVKLRLNYSNVWGLCKELLTGIAESAEFSEVIFEKTVEGTKQGQLIKEDLAKVVEEKFGMKVRVCGNCKYFKVDLGAGSLMAHGWCGKVPTGNTRVVFGGLTCVNNMLNGIMNAWEPKA